MRFAKKKTNNNKTTTTKTEYALNLGQNQKTLKICLGS